MGRFVEGEIRINEKILEEVLKNYIEKFLGKRYLFGVPTHNGFFGSPYLSYIRISQYPPENLTSPIVIDYQLLEEDREPFSNGITDLKEEYDNKIF